MPKTNLKRGQSKFEGKRVYKPSGEAPHHKKVAIQILDRP